MIRILILSILLFSCKKREIKEQEPVKSVKLFSSKVYGAQLYEIKKNGTISSPPFNVTSGDVVYVNCKAQISTPQSSDMTVFFYLDGVTLGGCANCSSYTETFRIQ